ncbi:bifunctional demethylmenaquinone methyltransferase/2-methoxy-6-polyprenyl-1,4-benzoquinol methylase UbiE [Deinococcus cavernae]|uniref:bifunctional demethylmenaquinone methyltransferase/2-methoxy-6-polyprenyl-1,4-benzoquinol methylase UbiE n=1 Tax=Deinococcus cavernae TaxID=2320857 RepID=UPI0023685608|nr:bifunctional demethylmenaquinone methyltransferase/2-methoxy-6-polyprenyl-1,4-benzoquinol methylase UbiE [Deinococcus cavernae]
MTPLPKKPPVGDRQDKGEDVQAMFASIAPTYDLLNRTLSLGVDRLWRREAVALALAHDPQSLLDVATGTADFAIELKRAAPHAEVIGSDFVPAMLEIGREKVRAKGLEIQLQQGDALNLPYPDNHFDAVTCSFGFRNFADYARGFAEMWRVLKPGGRVVILEFPPPKKDLFGQLFRFYFQQVLPRIGGLVSGNKAAYTYLPESTLAFPEPERLAGLMRATGFRTRYKLLTFGIAAIHVGDKR